MFMLFMVLDDSTRLADVLTAWQKAGIRGITVLESTGLHRILRRTEAHPMMAGFSQLLSPTRVGHNTLLAVIDEMSVAEAAVASTEAVLGSLDKPDTGLIWAVPVAKTWGVPQPGALNQLDDDPSA
jgi:hypothetical protein